MRPEAVFAAVKSSPRMPVAYVREYVQCQEHFSAANFIRSLARSTHDRNAPRRWVVTTRTCSEISQLPFSEPMQQQLVVGAPDTAIRVVSLSRIASRAHLDEALHRAVAPTDGGEGEGAAPVAHVVVLIVADRATVTTAQVNLATEAIAHAAATAAATAAAATAAAAAEAADYEGGPPGDDGVHGDAGGGGGGDARRAELVVTFVLLQHVSPEQLSFLGCSTVFLDGWEFLFCDAFGVKFTEDAGGDGGDVAAAGGGGTGGAQQQQQQQQHSLVRDSRLWIGAAYGLEAPLSAESIANEFSATFRTEVVGALKSAQYTGQGRGRRWPGWMGRATPAIAAAREQLAVRVLGEHPFLLRWGLRRAAVVWRGIMGSVVSDATAKIIAGQTVLSLLDITSRALTAVLRGYARFLARTALSNYNLDALLALEGAGAGAAARGDAAAIAGACFELCPEPSMQELETTADLEPSSVLATFKQKYIPRLPFVGHLLAAIGAARVRVLAGTAAAAGGALSDDDLIAAMTTLLRDGGGDGAAAAQARAMGTALDAISESPQAWRDLVFDYAALGLSLLDAADVELEVISELLQLCVDSRSPVALVVRGAAVQPGDVLDIMLPLRRLPALVPAPTPAATARALLGAGGGDGGGGGGAALLDALRVGVLVRVLDAFAADVAGGALSDGAAAAARDLCVKFTSAADVASLVPREHKDAFLRMWFTRAALLTLSGLPEAALLRAAAPDAGGAGDDAAGGGDDAYGTLAALFARLLDSGMPGGGGGVSGDADLAYEIVNFVLADVAVPAVAKRFVADALAAQATAGGGGAAAFRSASARLVCAMSTRMRLLFLRTLLCVRGPVSASVRDELNVGCACACARVCTYTCLMSHDFCSR